MKTQFVVDLTEGTRVDAPFALRAKEVREARTGDPYVAMDLADRTGVIPAVLFRPAANALEMPVGSMVMVTGRVTSFRNVKRISVESLRPCETWDTEDVLASSARPREELVTELRELVKSVKETSCRKVLRQILGDKAFFSQFCACPGSQSYHHAYVGGLLEHTIAVARLCRALGETYPDADSDLLVTSALLHDIGKVDELSSAVTIEYTDAGRLLGHVVLGATRIRSASHQCRGIDPDVAVRLQHAVLSHHGELEWGSPKKPSTLEALLLHHADNLDAKATGFTSLLSGAGAADERWTDATNLFRRPLYAPRAAEDDRATRADEDGQYHRLTA
jgi:3'-5' exoribonuclease